MTNTPSNRSFVFVTWDGGGNLPPAIGMAQDLVAMGHEVRFLGHRKQEAQVGSAGLPFRAFEETPDYDSEIAVSPQNFMPFLFDHIIFEPAMARDLEAEMARGRTDAVVVDCMLTAPLALLEAGEVPSAALVHTLHRFFEGWDLATIPGSPRLAGLRAGLGLPPVATLHDTWRGADRVLVVSPPQFDDGEAPLPANTVHVGAVADRRHGHGRWDPAWGAQSDQPLVLVSFSTTAMDQEDLLNRVADALSTLPVRALMTTGRGIDVDTIRPAPNTVVREFVRHTDVLPFVDLAVCHAGHGTVMAALANGVPLLCLPMGRDQPMVAGRVAELGAGRRLDPESDAGAIRDSVAAMLADPAFRIAAGQIASAMASTSPTAAADELIAMAKSGVAAEVMNLAATH